MELSDPKTRKIFAFVFLVFGVLIFSVLSVYILSARISLPPYSEASEGQYAAFGMMLWMFFWIMPLIFSLFLISYLIHPSKFEKFSKIKKFLFVIAAVCGFGAGVFLCALTFINNPLPENDALSYVLATIIESVFASLPFLAMGVLALYALKKDEKEYSLAVYIIWGILIAVILLAITAMAVMPHYMGD